MYILNIRPIGGSYGAIFPKDMLQDLNVGQGESLCAFQVEYGVLITAYDSALEAAWKAFEIGKKKYRQALQELSR